MTSAATGSGPWNEVALTGRGQFDSYMTMYVESDRPTLAPGQFERIAKALSDPRRFAMLEAIAAGQECPNQALCRDFPVSKATVSHHLKELVQSGLVESERDGQYMMFRARPEIMNAYAAELLRRVGGPQKPEP
jgi:ArsR family transcriptional regulator, arsenate/arsenite/antimonite-responsive transcriptional repressor